MVKRYLGVAAVALALSACQDHSASTKHLAPIPPATLALMSKKGMSPSDPIVIRAFKKESEMEVWKRGPDGQYAHLKTYPICRWSGQLGPKVKEGDRQAPEGFYTVTPGLMNPNSAYHLSFDTGFPNAFDRAHGRTGSHLMVHGNCSSRGCFAMTDEAIAEVYAIAREAFSGGQRGFQFQSYPFRMTAENLAKHRADPHIGFWKNLKEGSDHFEALQEEPRVAVCGGRYAFGDGSCAPAVPPAVAEKRRRDDQQVAELVAKGTPAVKVVYEDGGQHASFRETVVASAGDDGSAFAVLNARPRRSLGDVSRPDALAQGPREIVLETPKAKADKPATALAFKDAKPAAAKGSDDGKVKDAEGPTTVASLPATASEPAVAATPEVAPLYKRMFGSVLGPKPAPAPAPAVETAEPAAPPAVKAAPLPPRRSAATAAPKPKDAAPAAERRAQAPAALLSGAQPILATGALARVN